MIFEYPIDSLIKLSLDYERCFNQITSLSELQTPASLKSALLSLTKLIRLIDKPEIKTKYYQYFIKFEQTLKRYKKNQQADENKLNALIESIDLIQQKFNQHHDSKFTTQLLNENLISSLYCRLINKLIHEAHPSFLLQRWLEQPVERCLNDMNKWLDLLIPISVPIFKQLTILRQMAFFQPETVNGGFLQMSLHKKNVQLVRIEVDKKDNIYPEITCSYHGLSIKFLQTNFITPPKKITQPIKISMALCQL